MGSQGWPDGLAVKSAFCSSRRPEFGSYDTHVGSSHLPITLALGVLISLFSLYKYLHTTHTHGGGGYNVNLRKREKDELFLVIN